MPALCLATGDNARAADELDIYLQFPSVNATQRELLTQELHRLRQLPPSSAPHPLATATKHRDSNQTAPRRVHLVTRRIRIQPRTLLKLCV